MLRDLMHNSHIHHPLSLSHIQGRNQGLGYHIAYLENKKMGNI